MLSPFVSCASTSNELVLSRVTLAGVDLERIPERNCNRHSRIVSHSTAFIMVTKRLTPTPNVCEAYMARVGVDVFGTFLWAAILTRLCLALRP